MKKNVSRIESGAFKVIATALLGAALFATGCSSAPKLAESERSAQYVVERPNVRRIISYHRAKEWIENNPDAVIVVADEKARHLVARGTTKCNELKNWKDSNDYVLSYTLDISPRYGQTVLSFDELRMEPDPKSSDKTFLKTTHNIDTQADLDRVMSSCITPMYSELSSTITRSYGHRSIASE